MEGYISEIRMFGGNFAPLTWQFCQGQFLSIASNTALFSLLGTTYGGNGTTTFALPDFRGRAPVGTGQGPGLSNIDLGEMAGTPSITLLTTQMPIHTHGAIGPVTMGSRNGPGDSISPTGNYPAAVAGSNLYSTTQDAQMGAVGGSVTIATAGGSQPVSILQPYLGISVIICVEGIFPSRN
jgi:microcystin-dependent protein